MSKYTKMTTECRGCCSEMSVWVGLDRFSGVVEIRDSLEGMAREPVKWGGGYLCEDCERTARNAIQFRREALILAETSK